MAEQPTPTVSGIRQHLFPEYRDHPDLQLPINWLEQILVHASPNVMNVMAQTLNLVYAQGQLDQLKKFAADLQMPDSVG